MSGPGGGAPASVARVSAWRRLARLGREGEPAPASGDAELDSLGADSDRERAQSGRIVRGLLRQLGPLDALIARSGLLDERRTPEPLRWVVRIAAYEKIFQTGSPDYAIGQQAVALARVAGGAPAARFVNYVVRRLLPALPDSPEALAADPIVAALPDPERLSIPSAILSQLEAGWGAQPGRAVARALAAAEAPVWLRVNTLRTNRTALAAALEADGVQTEPGPLPESLRWTGGEGRPWRSAAWSRGELTVQDLAAMLAARLLEPLEGLTVADLCAAPGGKTGHLYELMGGGGRLLAAEIDPARRPLLKESIDRLYPPGHGIELLDSLAPAAAACDRVLIDAPCQALGLIGRHPEIRWDGRLRHQNQMQITQRSILERGAAWVRPGGRLLWVTCSPTRVENEGVVGGFLADRPAWRLVDLAPQVERLGVADWVQLDGGWARTRPDRAPCDGFAYGLLEHRAS